MKYSVRLTEEIARWVFEVHVLTKASDWFIAFTNPTAGPWKTLKVPNDLGEEEEVHRFGREEERPDVVLVSDAQETLIVVEAKDELNKLMRGDQPAKSARVVLDMWKVLAGLRSEPRWGERADYRCIGALLWGSEGPSDPAAAVDAIRDHKARLDTGGLPTIQGALGVEVRRTGGASMRVLGHVHPAGGLTGLCTSLDIEVVGRE